MSERGRMEQSNGFGWLQGAQYKHGVSSSSIRSGHGEREKLNGLETWYGGESAAAADLPDKSGDILSRGSEIVAPLVRGLGDVEEGEDVGSGEPDARFREVAAWAESTPEAEYNFAWVARFCCRRVHLEPALRAEPLWVGVVHGILCHFPATVVRDSALL